MTKPVRVLICSNAAEHAATLAAALAEHSSLNVQTASHHWPREAGVTAVTEDWPEVIVAQGAAAALSLSFWLKQGRRCVMQVRSGDLDLVPSVRRDLAALAHVDSFVFETEDERNEFCLATGVAAGKTNVITNPLVIGNFQPFIPVSANNLGVVLFGSAQDQVTQAAHAAVDFFEHYLVAYPQATLQLRALAQNIEPDRTFWRRINSDPRLRYRIAVDPSDEPAGVWCSRADFVVLSAPDNSADRALVDLAAIAVCEGATPLLDQTLGQRLGIPEATIPSDPLRQARLISILSRSRAHQRLELQIRSALHEAYGRTKWSRSWQSLVEGEHGEPAPSNTNKARRVIIVWGVDDWETFHRREMLTALAAALNAEERILFIDPHNHFTTLLRLNPQDRDRLKREALLVPRHPHPAVSALRLLDGGGALDVPRDPLLTKGLRRGEIAERLARRLHGDNVQILHWIYKPEWRLVLPDDADFAYEVYDDYTMDFSTGVRIQSVADAEPACLTAARHVFFTSEVLSQRKASHVRSSSVIANGVAFDAFRAARNALTIPDFSAGRPLIGYLGNLSDFFDWNLMLDLARAMPEVDFQLCGGIEWSRLEIHRKKIEDLTLMPNVVFSGQVSRAVGAAAMARCDALIIPFVVNAAMHAVNPLKLWEYLALGRPVVSAPLQAISLPYPLVRIARTKEEWCAAVHDALAEKDDEVTRLRIESASARDWSRLAEDYLRPLSWRCCRTHV